MQPGKPVVFGDLDSADGSDQAANRTHVPFFGLPGNPVSSAVTFLLFAAPLIAALAQHPHIAPRFAQARLAADVKQKPGLTRFLPASCNFDDSPVVALVPWQGSGDLAAMARSNCFLVLPEQTQQIKAGETVHVLLL
jgi:molybdopterin molybdotransferase